MERIKDFSYGRNGIVLLDTEDRIFSQYSMKSYNDPLRAYVDQYLDYNQQYKDLINEKSQGLEKQKEIPQALAPTPIALKKGSGKYFKGAGNSSTFGATPTTSLRGLKYIKF